VGQDGEIYTSDLSILKNRIFFLEGLDRHPHQQPGNLPVAGPPLNVSVTNNPGVSRPAARKAAFAGGVNKN
jgi:hypothetical protein